MKYRDSGMPEEEMWSTFFDPSEILNAMEVNNSIGTILDIGCGYGTFLIPESKIVSGKVIGIDIDEQMILSCKIKGISVENVKLICGDVSNPDTFSEIQNIIPSFDYITLFNILHCEEPSKLLNSVYSLLNPGGKIGVIHWKYEKTPRGPAMNIRPKPDQILEWSNGVGFKMKKMVDLPPYHFGIIFTK